MELKSIGKFAKRTGVTTIDVGIKNKKGITGTRPQKEAFENF